MAVCKIWIVIGVFTIVPLSIVLANSDPGYSKYYRLFNNRQKGYSGYGSVSLPKQNYQDAYYRNVGDAYKELPTRRGKTYHPQHSQYRAYPQSHGHYHDHHRKYFDGTHHRHHQFGKHGKYNNYPQLKPYPKPLPIPHPEPHPMPHPVPHPEPHPIPHPIPHPEPHPVPHPQPQPIPHPQPTPIPIPPIPTEPPRPVPTPQPVPNPQPHPIPSPSPLPIPISKPQPIPVPAPIPKPQPIPVPSPLPIPQPAPELVPEEDISLPIPPTIIRPIPIAQKPDIELPPEVDIPIVPIETIGRPPVAPSLKPPNFIELQRSVPGFVDIQKMNVDIRPLGEPTNVGIQNLQEFKALQNRKPNLEPILVEPIPEVSDPIETLFPINDVNFGDVIPGVNTPIETLFPVDEIAPVDTTQKLQPFNNFPNFQQISEQTAVRQRQRPVLNNINQQVRPNIPLLAKAVPAVPEIPESNPQPKFKNGNVNPETATATALLLQASMADFGLLPPSDPIDTPRNIPRPPIQSVPSSTPQVGFRRLPSVMLPDPVPAVPLGQP